MTLAHQNFHPQDDPPPGPVVLQLVGANPETDALANGIAYATTWKRDLGAACC